MSFQMRWSHTTHDLPFDDRQLDDIRADLTRRLDGWCARSGYVTEVTVWSVDNETFTPPDELLARAEIVSATVVLTATLRPRRDGVWGSVRAALDEDGLLPHRDRPGGLEPGTGVLAPPEPDPPWHRPARVGPWPGAAHGATGGTGGGAGGSTGAIVTGVDIARDGRAFVTYRCPDCEAICPSQTALRGHRRSAHGHGVVW